MTKKQKKADKIQEAYYKKEMAYWNKWVKDQKKYNICYHCGNKK